MERGVNIDGILVTWGDRLFYPSNRMVKGNPPPKLTGDALRRRAALIRGRIAATVRRAPQVMVKVTGGGRGMKAIAAHFRYISKNGRLDIEDDRGEHLSGPRAVRDLADDWRFSGGLIPEEAEQGGRREAYNVMLSMPRGTDPLAVQRAAREFARVELAGHKYVMVLHDHQANPHVHISVRAEGRDGRRLNPRKTDLHRWRETFAEKLRELGIDAEATRQATRGAVRNYDANWQTKARASGRLQRDVARSKSSPRSLASRASAVEAWSHLRTALEGSSEGGDMRLARGIAEMLERITVVQRRARGDVSPPQTVRDR
jgi:hypothetical protein